MFRYVFLVSFAVLLVVAGCADQPDVDDQTQAMAEQHADDSVQASPVVAEPRIPVYNGPVSYGTADGTIVTGFLSSPIRPDSVAEMMDMAPGDTSLPAVLLVHEWWGLNPHVRVMANRIAGEGFRVLAVDLYRDEVATTPDQAEMLMGQAMRTQERMMENMRAGYEYLTEEQYQAPSVAVMGWCFGGTVSLMTAAEMPQQLDAAVVYYGFPDQVSRDELSQLQMPVLGIFGAEDESIPVETVNEFRSTLEELGIEHDIHVYEDAGHAFANPTGQNYVEGAAEDAWDKTIAFLRETLYGVEAPVEGFDTVTSDTTAAEM